jgi:hypothetical protein
MKKKGIEKGIAAGKVVGAAGGIAVAGIFAMIAAGKERKRKRLERDAAVAGDEKPVV